MAVQKADVENTIKDITSNLGVVRALLGRKVYDVKEYQEINKKLGAAATFISRAVAAGRKLGESNSDNLVDRIDNRLDEMFEDEV